MKCCYRHSQLYFNGEDVSLCQYLKCKLHSSFVGRVYYRAYHWWTAIDFSQIEDIEVNGIDTRDYPDFCDAYISSCTYKGREATDRELERINENSDFVYNAVLNHIY